MLRLFCFVIFVLNLSLLTFSVHNYSRDEFPPHFIFGVIRLKEQRMRMGGLLVFGIPVLMEVEMWQLISITNTRKMSNSWLKLVWSRLIPNGRGPVNPKGLEYYNNLINELISHVGGYDHGITPPGRCSAPLGLVNCSNGNSSSEPYLAVHHMLLAHASTVRLYKEKYQDQQNGVISVSLFTFWFVPLTNSTEDVAATERAKDFYLGWIINPLVFGDYPEIMKKNVCSRLPALTKQESKLVKGAFDFLGVIHYSTVYVKDHSKGLKLETRDFSRDIELNLFMQPDDPHLILPEEFPERPWGLQGVLEYIKQTYGNPPVYIHENGQASPHNSSLEDTSRVDYLQACIGSVLDSIRNGSDTRGYFVWSFLDVFELLSNGFGSSYGLYFIDLEHPDLQRQARQSAHWYSSFLKVAEGNIQLDKENVFMFQ